LKLLAATLASLSLLGTSLAYADQTKGTPMSTTSSASATRDDIRSVSPALEKYATTTIQEGLWSRPGLTPRDRSIVTVATLIARNQAVDMPRHIALALDNGVKPGEISEIITHLAFYSGWANAMSAVAFTKDIFAQRAAGVQQNFGEVAAGVLQYTTDLLFKDLWLRPDLAPRDRSLVTVSSLIASGQVAQMPYHLNRAMDNGLTKEQASEVLTHIAFYAGWPNVFSALPVAKGVFEGRPS